MTQRDPPTPRRHRAAAHRRLEPAPRPRAGARAGRRRRRRSSGGCGRSSRPAVRIEIVFDGPPDRGLRGTRIASGLTVRHSGRYSADSLHRPARGRRDRDRRHARRRPSRRATRSWWSPTTSSSVGGIRRRGARTRGRAPGSIRRLDRGRPERPGDRASADAPRPPPARAAGPTRTAATTTPTEPTLAARPRRHEEDRQPAPRGDRASRRRRSRLECRREHHRPAQPDLEPDPRL